MRIKCFMIFNNDQLRERPNQKFILLRLTLQPPPHLSAVGAKKQGFVLNERSVHSDMFETLRICSKQWHWYEFLINTYDHGVELNPMLMTVLEVSRSLILSDEI